MAVKGIEKFTEYFKKYEDCYTIIGGAACDILMSSAKLDFRATKDIDMIELYINNILRKRYDIKDREELREKKRTMRAKKKQPSKVAKKKK